ncbi:MAG TPA: DsrE family protein [Candidatus Saccharimonadia bacterium]|nr:DsrE family protein [Candidatus Saccharimonadia bacterium]
MKRKSLTFALMDAPFESARTVTAIRLIELSLRRGHDVNVFAYEGAAALTFSRQSQHPNATHGRTLEEEDHPLTHRWVAALLELAAANDVKLDWVNCGLCVDERGVGETIPGVRRGGPPDFFKLALDSFNTLVIPTR